MKKVLLFVLLAGFAFSAAAVEVAFGVKAGLTVNKARLENIVDNHSRLAPGLQLGGLAEIKLGRKISIQPELLFTFNMDKVAADTDPDDNYMDFREMYLEIPLLCKYNLALRGNKTLSFYAGPSLFLSIAGPDDRSTSGGTTTPWEDSNDLTGGNLAINAGASLGMGKLLLDLRVSIGLKDKIDDSSEGFRTLSFTLAAGYKL